MPRIFDNIAIDLLPALRDTLEISQRSDFCVGYFNLRGWKAIDGMVDKWSGEAGHQCRLLVGMQRLPQDELRQAYSLLPQEEQVSNQAVIRLKRRLAKEFQDPLICGCVQKRGGRNLENKKAGENLLRLFFERLAATYSRGSYTTTTIGKTAFDGRVRNGNGSDRSFIATKLLWHGLAVLYKDPSETDSAVL